VDEVAAQVEEADRRRTALHEDLSPRVAEVDRAVAELGALPVGARVGALQRLDGAVAELRTAFAHAASALDELASAKEAQATAPVDPVAARGSDRGAAERSRKAAVDAAVAGEVRERAARARDAYLEAWTAADEAARAYERLAARSARVAGAPDGDDVRDLARLARSAAGAAQAYRESWEAARPAREVIAAGVPTGHLPNLDD